MTILRRNRSRESRRETFVFLAGLLHRTAGDEILELLIRAEAQHFLATTGGITGAQVLVHDVEDLLELERRAAGEHGDQFLGDKVWNSAGKCVFLENGHMRRAIYQYSPRFAAVF